MSTPSEPVPAPAEEQSLVLGPGAYGDPAEPEQSRTEYQDLHPDAPEPANPSSDPTLIVGPEGSVDDPNAALPPADPSPVQAPSAPSGHSTGAPLTPGEAAATS